MIRRQSDTICRSMSSHTGADTSSRGLYLIFRQAVSCRSTSARTGDDTGSRGLCLFFRQAVSCRSMSARTGDDTGSRGLCLFFRQAVSCRRASHIPTRHTQNPADAHLHTNRIIQFYDMGSSSAFGQMAAQLFPLITQRGVSKENRLLPIRSRVQSRRSSRRQPSGSHRSHIRHNRMQDTVPHMPHPSGRLHGAAGY